MNNLGKRKINVTDEEWANARRIFATFKKNGIVPDRISKRDFPGELNHSFFCYNGELYAKTNEKIGEKILGEGTFGKVALLANQKGGLLALKIVAEKKGRAISELLTKEEIAVMDKLGQYGKTFQRKHHKRMKLAGESERKKIIKQYVIMEFYQGRSLEEEQTTSPRDGEIIGGVKPELHEDKKLMLAIKMIDSAAELHEKFNVVHADFKPENAILREKEGYQEVILIDFGKSQQLKKNEYSKEVNYSPGSPGFYMENCALSYKTDVIGLGNSAFSLLKQERIYKNNKKLRNVIKKMRFNSSEDRSAANAYNFELKKILLEKEEFLANMAIIPSYKFLKLTEDDFTQAIHEIPGVEKNYLTEAITDGLSKIEKIEDQKLQIAEINAFFSQIEVFPDSDVKETFIKMYARRKSERDIVEKNIKILYMNTVINQALIRGIIKPETAKKLLVANKKLLSKDKIEGVDFENLQDVNLEDFQGKIKEGSEDDEIIKRNEEMEEIVENFKKHLKKIKKGKYGVFGEDSPTKAIKMVQKTMHYMKGSKKKKSKNKKDPLDEDIEQMTFGEKLKVMKGGLNIVDGYFPEESSRRDKFDEFKRKYFLKGDDYEKSVEAFHVFMKKHKKNVENFDKKIFAEFQSISEDLELAKNTIGNTYLPFDEKKQIMESLLKKKFDKFKKFTKEFKKHDYSKAIDSEALDDEVFENATPDFLFQMKVISEFARVSVFEAVKKNDLEMLKFLCTENEGIFAAREYEELAEIFYSIDASNFAMMEYMFKENTDLLEATKLVGLYPHVFLEYKINSILSNLEDESEDESEENVVKNIDFLVSCTELEKGKSASKEEKFRSGREKANVQTFLIGKLKDYAGKGNQKAVDVLLKCNSLFEGKDDSFKQAKYMEAFLESAKSNSVETFNILFDKSQPFPIKSYNDYDNFKEAIKAATANKNDVILKKLLTVTYKDKEHDEYTMNAILLMDIIKEHKGDEADYHLLEKIIEHRPEIVKKIPKDEVIKDMLKLDIKSAKKFCEIVGSEDEFSLEGEFFKEVDSFFEDLERDKNDTIKIPKINKLLSSASRAAVGYAFENNEFDFLEDNIANGNFNVVARIIDHFSFRGYEAEDFKLFSNMESGYSREDFIDLTYANFLKKSLKQDLANSEKISDIKINPTNSEEVFFSITENIGTSYSPEFITCNCVLNTKTGIVTMNCDKSQKMQVSFDGMHTNNKVYIEKLGKEYEAIYEDLLFLIEDKKNTDKMVEIIDGHKLKSDHLYDLLLKSCEHGNSEVLKCLIKKGVDYDRINEDGFNALKFALDNEDETSKLEILNVLLHINTQEEFQGDLRPISLGGEKNFNHVMKEMKSQSAEVKGLILEGHGLQEKPSVIKLKGEEVLQKFDELGGDTLTEKVKKKRAERKDEFLEKYEKHKHDGTTEKPLDAVKVARKRKKRKLFGR